MHQSSQTSLTVPSLIVQLPFAHVTVAFARPRDERGRNQSPCFGLSALCRANQTASPLFRGSGVSRQ
jgi:hypothetical protein